MSRGERVVTTGNLQKSMRDNYASLGVDVYYRKVGSTYRNPHFPGVRQCLFHWFTRWWQMEQFNLDPEAAMLFDMACGTRSYTGVLTLKYSPSRFSGEVTVCFIEWWRSGLSAYHQAQNKGTLSSAAQEALTSLETKPTPTRAQRNVLTAPPIDPESAVPRITAADPFTSEAFTARTSLPCTSLSFHDIAEGSIPSTFSYVRPSASQNTTAGLHDNSNDEVKGDGAPQISIPVSTVPLDSGPDASLNSSALSPPTTIETVVCSFALHLITNPSELFSLLWELSSKARWLVVLAPHKKPEIKEGWGWVKWNIESWSECSMHESKGELLKDRVHCRVYRSINTL